MQTSQFYYMAATGYNCDAYGANNYGECSTTSTGTGGTGSSGSGGLLADTGYAVLVPLALAIAIAGAAVILLIKRLVRRKHDGHDVHGKKSNDEPKDLV